jgi:hypothetical protein
MFPIQSNRAARRGGDERNNASGWRTDRARRACRTEPFDKTSLRDKLDSSPFYIEADVTAMHWSLCFVPGMDAVTKRPPDEGFKDKAAGVSTLPRRHERRRTSAASFNHLVGAR